jgi:deoxyribodipyrimidine photo-lyase
MRSMAHPIIVWFRNDLRLADHQALTAAALKGPVVPLYIYSEEEEGEWPLGGASKVYLHDALIALKQSIPELLILEGRSLDVLLQVAEATGAKGVYWGRRYEPFSIARDSQVKEALKKKSLEAVSFNHSLLLEPWNILNKSKEPYTVFTPYYKAVLRELEVAKPLPIPQFVCFNHPIPSDDLKLLPKVHWDRTIHSSWKAGETQAVLHLKAFCEGHLHDYEQTRNYPAIDQGVSHLSPALHFGEISPRTIWHRVSQSKDGEPYLRQLVWRDFAHYLLYHFPHTDLHPLRKLFEAFPWHSDEAKWEAWKKGRTGYPFVDAGMRELWATGWMHNRVRMVVASFLVKDLLLPWQQGARYFWDTLVDADLANNTFGWQWSAGCGADAAPYFRIFNPTLQGEKFDPEGDYIRKWVPELKQMPSRWIHQPHTAPTRAEEYPLPIVDHAKAKEAALAAFHTLKEESHG